MPDDAIVSSGSLPSASVFCHLSPTRVPTYIHPVSPIFRPEVGWGVGGCGDCCGGQSCRSMGQVKNADEKRHVVVAIKRESENQVKTSAGILKFAGATLTALANTSINAMRINM